MMKLAFAFWMTLDARPEAVLVGATLLLLASGLRRGLLPTRAKEIGD